MHVTQPYDIYMRNGAQCPQMHPCNPTTSYDSDSHISVDLMLSLFARPLSASGWRIDAVVGLDARAAYRELR